jgi:hypothetical protein
VYARTVVAHDKARAGQYLEVVQRRCIFGFLAIRDSNKEGVSSVRPAADSS